MFVHIRKWIGAWALLILLSTTVLAAPPNPPDRRPPPPPGTPPAPAPNPPPPSRPRKNVDESRTYTGRLVTLSAAQLVVADDMENEHKHTISPTVEVILNDRRCELTDLRKGMTVEVTTRPVDPKTAVRIVARARTGK